jgi:hypothetical protein
VTQTEGPLLLHIEQGFLEYIGRIEPPLQPLIQSQLDHPLEAITTLREHLPTQRLAGMLWPDRGRRGRQRACEPRGKLGPIPCSRQAGE